MTTTASKSKTTKPAQKVQQKRKGSAQGKKVQPDASGTKEAQTMGGDESGTESQTGDTSYSRAGMTVELVRLDEVPSLVFRTLYKFDPNTAAGLVLNTDETQSLKYLVPVMGQEKADLLLRGWKIKQEEARQQKAERELQEAEERQRKMDKAVAEGDMETVTAMATWGFSRMTISFAGEYSIEERLQPKLTTITALNRDLNEARWRSFRDTMTAGKWYSSPDPIVISSDHEVLNGQHRIMAALNIVWGSDDDLEALPYFVVVSGVDKKAALLMDEAKRSATDRRDIALRYAEALETSG